MRIGGGNTGDATSGIRRPAMARARHAVVDAVDDDVVGVVDAVETLVG